ncbi:hypothetical protein BGX26_005146 [Mortierella sp. AD094]|nr:hypothetical protein BGX26_005146 [Mortierella sp. AD094]
MSRSGIVEVSAIERYRNAALIPHKCTAFKFDATFKDQEAGRYYIVWKIMLEPGFFVPWGFHVEAIISYEDEPAESSGSLDITVSEVTIKELSLSEWRDITIQEQLVIRPHRGAVNVQLYLSNNEDPNKGNKENKEHNEYHNFKVGSVEIHPYTNLGPDFISHSPTIGDPFASLNIKRADNIPISRISAATDVDHIAVLRVAKDKVHIGIWDYGGIQDQPKDANSLIDWEPKAETTLDNQSGIHELPLGISLSPDGRQLAVFQEPMIGEWRDGSDVEDGKFKFQLFDVPVTVPTLGEPQMVTVEMEPIRPELSRSVAASNIWSLQSFVGFAKFLPVRDLPLTEKIEHSVKPNTNNHQVLFATCNGMYLDIFDCNKNPWFHLHSIALTDLSTTLSRRITCQMMVESVGSDTFLWLEAQGQTCSTWSIDNGVNISRISSEDNVAFSGPVYRSNLKMAISPNGSIVTLAGIDGGVRTFFVNSGIEISGARFKNSKIEYLGFLGRNDRIMAIIRNSITHQLQSRILDPMDLTVRIKSDPVPIPTAGTNLLLASRRGSSELNNQATICAAEGTLLRFYRIQDTLTMPTVKPETPFAKEDLRRIPVTIDSNSIKGDPGFEKKEKVFYKLRTIAGTRQLENGDGKDYWVLRVSLLKETETSEEDVFNFVPEPWLRCLTNEYTMPEKLSATYFLSCGKRFVIIGFQSIQIWVLPSKDNPKVKLLTFWSMPAKEFLLSNKRLKSSGRVFDHFQMIDSAKVYDIRSDFTHLNVKLSSCSKYEDIILPGVNQNTSHYGDIPCCLSIHLLAAAYLFASRNQTFEQHANELITFSLQHINRITALDDILTTIDNFSSGTKGLRLDGEIPVNTLSLLLNNSGFRHTSNPFIKAMLSTGRPWIPREQLSLNPIHQAIDSKNCDIAHTLVDYCIENAKKHHPAYLGPAVQSLKDLTEHCPEITARMFSEASYIKVKNKSYVAANAIIANPHYKFWKTKSKSLDDYTNPVFYLRSQLPFRSNVQSTLSEIFLDTMQIYENSKSNNAVINPSDTDIMDRKYLKNWVPALYIVIILGGACIMFEIWQIILDWRQYFKSPYNYLDLISFIFPVIGCGEFLYVSKANPSPEGPSQIWWISFALLAVYINVLFELKVFRPLGIVVNIILNIAQRILWFLVVLAITLVAFTHAFMHITHTKRDPCINKTGDDLTTCEATKSEYPGDPSAIFSTFFFIAGIYDPLNKDLDPASKSGYSFKILLALFILFTVILLMNVLIAIMNDGYSESRDEGQLAWLKQWSQVIVETELSMMGNSTRRNRDFFPDYIYYAANLTDMEDHVMKASQTQTSEALANREPPPPTATMHNPRPVHEELNYLRENQRLLMQLVSKLEKHNSGERLSRTEFSASPSTTTFTNYREDAVEHATKTSTLIEVEGTEDVKEVIGKAEVAAIAPRRRNRKDDPIVFTEDGVAIEHVIESTAIIEGSKEAAEEDESLPIRDGVVDFKKNHDGENTPVQQTEAVGRTDPGSSLQSPTDETQHSIRTQKSYGFIYDMQRQSTDRVDSVFGGKPR